MRILFIWTLVICISACELTASEYWPRWSELPCQICIERTEDHGILNIRETRVVVDDKQALVMLGGQAACVFVPPGSHFVYAESYDPYDPSSKDPKAWLSNRINFNLEKGKRAQFELRRSDDSTENRWLLIRVE